jgi:V-type H+-transporting ATPase subunit E
MKSSAVSNQRKRKLQDRQTLIDSLLQNAKSKTADYVKADAKRYSELLTDLAVQGMIALDESEYVLRVRQVDLAATKKIAQDALKKYQAIIFKETGVNVTATVTVNEEERMMLPPPPSSGAVVTCCGGIVVSAAGNRIVCDNTLDSRLELAFDDLKPHIRKLLFPSEVKIFNHGSAAATKHDH